MLILLSISNPCHTPKYLLFWSCDSNHLTGDWYGKTVLLLPTYHGTDGEVVKCSEADAVKDFR